MFIVETVGMLCAYLGSISLLARSILADGDNGGGAIALSAFTAMVTYLVTQWWRFRSTRRQETLEDNAQREKKEKVLQDRQDAEIDRLRQDNILLHEQLINCREDAARQRVRAELREEQLAAASVSFRPWREEDSDDHIRLHGPESSHGD